MRVTVTLLTGLLCLQQLSAQTPIGSIASYAGSTIDFQLGKFKPSKVLYAALPTASANTDVVYLVTDCTSAACTAGGGVLRAWLVSNGTSWVLVGGAGGSGGGTGCVVGGSFGQIIISDGGGGCSSTTPSISGSTITATTFVGALTGNSSTTTLAAAATALAVEPANCASSGLAGGITAAGVAEACRPPASQAEAEAGADNTNFMTPLRTSQAITALGGTFSVASQAEAQAGTDNVKGMTPLRAKQSIDTFAQDIVTCTAANITGSAAVNFDTAGSGSIRCSQIVLTPITSATTSFVVTGGGPRITVIFTQGGTGFAISGLDATLVGWCTPSATANKYTIIEARHVGSNYYQTSCASDDPEVLGVTLGGTGFSSYTKGDWLCPSGSTTMTKLGVGSTGQIPYADPTATCGIKWDTAPSGGSGGGGSGPFTTLSDGATITWPLASAGAAKAKVTIAGDRTLNITGPASGGDYVLWLRQGSGGSHGLALGTGCTWRLPGGGGGTITPSTVVDTFDVLSFTYDGSHCIARFDTDFGTEVSGGGGGSSINTTYAGSCTGAASGATGCTLDSATSGGGDLVIVARYSDSNGGYVTSGCTIGGVAMTQVSGATLLTTDGSGNYFVDLWYKQNTATGQTAVACGGTTGTNGHVYAYRYTGASTSAAFDTVTDGTTAAPGSITTAVDNEMIFIIGTFGSASAAACTGFTQLHTKSFNQVSNTQSKAAGVAGSTSVAGCQSTPFFTAYRIVAFK